MAASLRQLVVDRPVIVHGTCRSLALANQQHAFIVENYLNNLQRYSIRMLAIVVWFWWWSGILLRFLFGSLLPFLFRFFLRHDNVGPRSSLALSVEGNTKVVHE